MGYNTGCKSNFSASIVTTELFAKFASTQTQFLSIAKFDLFDSTCSRNITAATALSLNQCVFTLNFNSNTQSGSHEATLLGNGTVEYKTCSDKICKENCESVTFGPSTPIPFNTCTDDARIFSLLNGTNADAAPPPPYQQQ